MTQVMQASAVLLAGRVMLIEGPPGSGKSTLALQLIDRGAQLVGDDGVSLADRDGRLWASPPPNTAGLIELRNVGLLRMPTGEGPVALHLALTPDAPRFVESATARSIAGSPIPHLAFDAAIPAAAIRAERAMALHGLP